MLFNSVSYGIFLPIVFLLYYFVFKSLKHQNLFLLAASYFFYGCWNWHFTLLLAFSTYLDFYCGQKIHTASTHRKTWLYVSIIINVGFLAIFKYYNFFATSLADLLSQFGMKVNINLLNIILPVGISFYTFHGLSYVFDIYTKRIKPTKNAVDYALFVSFFPLLVAGPIERAAHLLPQIQNNRIFSSSKALDGFRQIIWGLFKKTVIADSCATFADSIFNSSQSHNGSTLFLGAFLFTFQIYGDFSGYSDIALGTARLFGFELLQNFSFPYFSRNMAEFWRKWHISLSSWFKDYLYIPLGGSRGSTWNTVKNTLIIFIVSGFWHGANWTFIVWGALNAILVLPSMIKKTNRINIDVVARGKIFPSINEAISIISTFVLIVFTWIFFRANSITDAFQIISTIFSKSFFSKPEVLPKTVLLYIFLFMIIEWLGRDQRYALEKLGNSSIKFQSAIHWAFCYILVIVIFIFTGNETQFIYFQF